jgi:hypothetical protein
LTPAAILALGLALGAPPAFEVEAGAPDGAERVAADGWRRVEALLAREGAAPPSAPRPVRIGPSAEVPAGTAAVSRPGVIALRPGLGMAGRGATALVHEVAHQVLFEACPAASGDGVFHEAFAMAASGELERWADSEDGPYLPLAQALELLGRSRSLDTPAARRALARLLAESPAAPDRLPAALAGRLGACEAGAPWRPMRPADLAEGGAAAADALVVLSRHSGEALRAEGAASLPLPFGSTLKPFLLASATRPTPRLAPDASSPGWRCGDEMPAEMDAATALLRSCNGWFLAWAERDPAAVRLGPWGVALTALGLSALPADASEAIGIRPALRISPLGLAHAYRLLAEARPDLVDVLSRNSAEGTLSRLPASPALAGVAAKTGTVLDAAGQPRLGWIVAVDADVVVVMARAGRTPRSFAAELAAALLRARRPAHGAARVQVLGLLDPGDVVARCPGTGFIARASPTPIPPGPHRLSDLTESGPAVCAGGPWLVTPPGRAERAYAGIFSLEPAPPLESPAGPAPTPREARARRGSDLVFRTTRILYAAGVVAAEDGAARGEARIALARVADANQAHSRHPGRPVCDTTHCQAFLGTRAPAAEDRKALESPHPARAWLPFSRGGTEPWRAERSVSEVERALGPGARAAAMGAGRVSVTVTASDGEGRWEERRELGCEALRAPLKLPSCPERARREGARWIFEGRGEGHGEGLDVEWAKRSGLGAEEILARAYGPSPAASTRSSLNARPAPSGCDRRPRVRAPQRIE